MAKQKQKASGRYSSGYTGTYYDLSCALSVHKVHSQSKGKAKAKSTSRHSGGRKTAGR